MALVENDNLTDYSIDGVWNGKDWGVWVERSDNAVILRAEGDKNPDFTNVLWESCLAIRNDMEDRADGELPYKSAPLGRYVLSYHPTNPNYAFLLDSKTGAVWELTHQTWSGGGKLGNVPYRKFERVSVDGLYTGVWAQEVTRDEVRKGPGTEDERKSRLHSYEESWKGERDRENALDH